ncbi:uncharacterized protein TNCV_238111 [Trichonephila clavipes]|nr:uncharacterized protein TNCV_238111 [Trichonephila clavipes]
MHHRKSDEMEIRAGSSDSNSSHHNSSSFESVQRRSNKSQYGRKKGSGKKRELEEKRISFKKDQVKDTQCILIPVRALVDNQAWTLVIYFIYLQLLNFSFISFLGKGKKADLIKLAIELGECESNGEELKIIELRTKILTNDAYKEDPEFVKCIFEGIVSNRIDEENKQKEQTLREFELQKIRLQNESQRVVGPQTLPQTKIELKKLLSTFNPEVDNMDLFLTLFERQMKLLDLGEDPWVPYLLRRNAGITPTFEECFCNGSN